MTAPIPRCSTKSHQWELSIDEGQVSLSTDSCGEECHYRDPHAPADIKGHLGDEVEWLTMAPIPVKVVMATACPAYETDDDGAVTGPPKPMAGYESGGGHWIAHGSLCDCDWWPLIRLVSKS